jgi:hypothetical protein
MPGALERRLGDPMQGGVVAVLDRMTEDQQHAHRAALAGSGPLMYCSKDAALFDLRVRAILSSTPAPAL